MKKRFLKRLRGFTITELMVVAAVVAILAAFAVPSYLSYVANNRAKRIATLINAAISVAKNEAVHRGLSVELCGLTALNSGTCDETATSWQYGFQIAVLPLNLIAHTYLPNGADSIVITPASSIIFSPNGFPSPQAFSIMVKPSGCTEGYEIVYDATGATGRLTTRIVNCP